MDTEIIKRTGEIIERNFALTQEQVDLLQRTICKDHTPDEVALFVQYCRAKKLDPFGKEIYSVKRGGKITFQIGIDTLRAKAEESGDYNGQETEWCDENGKWVNVWTSTMPPFAAKVCVYRKGIDKPFAGIANWTEYKPVTEDWMWKKMPANQLAKCAEALALRKAFPTRLGGLYTDDEMEQANNPSKMPKIAMPKPKKAEEPKEAEIVEPKSMEEVIEAPIEFSEPPIGSTRETKAAFEAQKPKTKEQIEKAMRPPQSKFFAQLHKVVREKEVPEEIMKIAIKDRFGLESSKDLTDAQCAELIKAVEKGSLRAR